MLKNYSRTAWKTIVKNRMYSTINILGLTIGLWSCMIVATVVMDDLSYDRQWSKGNDIYRIISLYKMGEGVYDRSASSFAGLGTSLRKDFPEVETVGELSTYTERLKLDENNPNGLEFETLRADTNCWKMLDLAVLEGNPRNYIAGSRNMVVSESFRKKFFPTESPVGKIVYDVPTYSDKPTPYVITGVIKDLPANTHLRSEIMLLEKPREEQLNKEQYGTFSQNYILMKKGTDMKLFTQKLNKWYAGQVESKTPYQFEFQPIKDVYLHSDFAEYQEVKGSYNNIYILSGVAFLLLLIACVNFVNLSTARGIHRLKETGIRKLLGAGRRQIIYQFLAESMLFFIIASLLATVLYQAGLGYVEQFIGHPFAKTFVAKSYLFIAAYAAILLISLLTGFYPAWIMSGFKPAATLKGKLGAGNFIGQHFVRKSLVVLQFSISVVVLVALIVVQQQVSFMKNKDIGFDKNDLLSIGSISWDGKGVSFKNELMKQQGVENVSITSWIPTSGRGYMSKSVDDPSHPGNKMTVWFINADIDLAKTLGLRLQKGRFFEKQFSTDAVSQDSMRNMDEAEYKAAAGKQSSLVSAYTAKILKLKGLDETIANVQTKPVGIVEDFNKESLKTALQPTVIIADDSPGYGGMLIRVKPGTDKEVVASLNKLWKEFYPDKLLDVKWVDDMLAGQYKEEQKLQQLFTFFSSLSMFLAALGIFGLIVQAAAQRVKEIGIRKVLGASVRSIVQLFSIDFLKLVLVAIIIASPIAWWLMHVWLNDFAYRIKIEWWMFALAGFVSLMIALITVSFQAVKTAISNPIKSLRTE